MKKIILQKGKEKSIERFHPWIFSGAVKRQDKDLNVGDIVEVFDAEGHYLATGHYHPSSICVRIFSFDQVNPGKEFWKRKIENALHYRQNLNFFHRPDLTIFRLINGEGDGLPGFIADWFDGNVVFQFHSYGMYLLREVFRDIFKEIFGMELLSIYDKSSATLLDCPDLEIADEWLYGSSNEIIVKEYGIPFRVDVVNGQKTGFFIDQRENRRLVGKFSQGRKVLNMFCYSGGFSLHALAHGAELVHSVDISKKAIELTKDNASLLGHEVCRRHEAYAEDVFEFLNAMPNGFYDLIILDPPAFAKHYKAKEQGLKGYRNINKRAMEKIKCGGLLFTFSCSQAISREDFQTMLFSAAALAHKEVRILKHLEQGIDHPTDIFHPEGSYLKGLLVEVQ